MDDVLLIAADPQLRRLVYAQLLEEGLSVLALPSLRAALGYLLRGGEPARLAVLDVQGQEVTASEIGDLWALSGRAPLIVCGGALNHALLSEPGLPPATVLWRPFSVGQVVDEVKKVLR